MLFAGSHSFAYPLQGPISHLILRGFERRMAKRKKPHLLRTIRAVLKEEIDLFHNQLKFPFGQICSMQRNIKENTECNTYYAIKTLSTIIGIIECENYVQTLLFTDLEFKISWRDIKLKVKDWLEVITTNELDEGLHLTPSTLNLNTTAQREKIREDARVLIEGVKDSWQIIWRQFNDVKRAFEFVLVDQPNSDLIYNITDFKPSFIDDFFNLSIDSEHNIRLWHSKNKIISKAMAKNKPIAWSKVDEVYTSTKPTWYIYVKKLLLNNQSDSENESEICSVLRSGTTLY